MPTLKENPTLKDFQEYVVLLEEERGFSKQSIIEKCLMLGEECGELFKAVRKNQKIKVDNNSKEHTVDEELADVLIFVLSIANKHNINLEKAFREKEEVNKKRVWS